MTEIIGTRSIPLTFGGTLRRRAASFRFRELTLLPAIGLALLAGSLVSSAFLTTGNLLNILRQSSDLSVVVIAESLILIAGKFDLSLESIIGLSPMIGVWLIVKDPSAGGSGIGLNGYAAIAVVLVSARSLAQ